MGAGFDSSYLALASTLAGLASISAFSISPTGD